MIRKRPVVGHARAPRATPEKPRRPTRAGDPPFGSTSRVAGRDAGDRRSTPRRAALYVRVSTDDQRLDLQLHAGRERVRDRGWTLTEVYEDQGVSGSRARRPGLDRMLIDARARRFDVLVVWRSDRLFRSLSHMVTTLEELAALGVEFASCTEVFDSTTPQGRLLMHMTSAFAQFERELAIERTRAGLAAARRRGSAIGRPRRRVDVDRGRELLASGYSQRAAAAELGVGFGTFQRAMRAA